MRLLAIVLIIIGFVSVLGFLAGSRMNTEAVHSETTVAIRQAPRGSALVTNILLVGVDEDHPRDRGGRADTLILLSIDHRTRTLKLTSILRDSWVPFPDGSHYRINRVSTGRRGGGSLAMQVVSQNFGVRIDHYLMFGFNAFKAIIDAIGGISVPMTLAEINALTNDTRLGHQIGHAEMERQMEQDGAVRLNGEQALIYVRIRRRDTDLDRARRNRTMIEAIVNRLHSQPWRIFPLAMNALPEFYTSLSPWRTATLAVIAPAVAFYSIEQHQLPAPGTFHEGHPGGLFALEIDFPANRRLLREFIYG